MCYAVSIVRLKMKQYVHVSDIQAFLQCRRAWDLSSNLRQHLTTIQLYAPFFIGTVVHKFLEDWLHPTKPYIPQETLATLHSMPGAMPELIEFGCDVLDHYIQWQYADNSQWADQNLTVLSVEQPFDVPIYTPSGYPSSKFRFAGRVDGVWRSNVDGRLYLHEIKTTTSIDSRIGQLQFEMQPTAYMVAMSEVYNEPIAGVVYTLIRKKLPVEPDVLKNWFLSQNKGIDTTPELYLAAIKRQHPTMSKGEIKSYYGEI